MSIVRVVFKVSRFTILGLMLSSITYAGDVKLKELGVKVDPLKRPPADLNVKSHVIIGECDGQKYENPNELEGCQRRVSARFFKTVPIGNQPAAVPPKNSIEE